MSYKKGSDLKIKGIENLEGLPDTTIYKCDKAICIEAGGELNIGDKIGIITHHGKKPEGFEGW